MEAEAGQQARGRLPFALPQTDSLQGSLETGVCACVREKVLRSNGAGGGRLTYIYAVQGVINSCPTNILAKTTTASGIGKHVLT